MLPNLAALATMGLAAIGAAVLLRRYLPRADLALRPVCTRCGTAGAALKSFVCPGCNHDVREAGLGPPRGRSRLTPFWSFVAFTTAFLVAAVVLSGVVLSAMPNIHKVSRNTTMHLASPEVHGHGVELNVEGLVDDKEVVHGRLSGELYSVGGIVSLDLQTPSMNWRLLDDAGNQLEAGQGLNRDMIFKWLSHAGLDVTQPIVVFDAIQIAVRIEQLVGVKIPMPPPPAVIASYSSSSGGSSSNQPDERNLPYLVVAWSGIWLAGVWLVLRSSGAARGRTEPRAAIPTGGMAS